MDYSKAVTFSDSETEDQSKTTVVEVSERTEKYLQEKCTQRVSNSDRKEVWDRYPLPKVSVTRTPQLDPIMKSEASTTTKAADKQLARVHTLLLDSLPPLTTSL